MGIKSGVVIAIETDPTDADELGAGSAQEVSAFPVPAPDSAHAFSEWVQPHWHGMAILARRLAPLSDWEDVLQEALSAAWRKRHQYVPRRGSARN